MPAFLVALLPHLTQLAAVAVTVGVGYLANWLRSKTKSDRLRSMEERVAGVVGDVVDAMSQVVVADLKKTGDGHLTAEQAGQIKGDAVKAVKDTLTDAGLKELSGATGIPADKLDDYLGMLIEATVHRNK